MTYEESIHKMLEQVLKNQVQIIRALKDAVGGVECGWYPSIHREMESTKSLLEQVKA